MLYKPFIKHFLIVKLKLMFLTINGLSIAFFKTAIIKLKLMLMNLYKQHVVRLSLERQ